MGILIIVLLAITVGVGAAIYTGINDGPIEQAAEKVIEIETGEKVDLTPSIYEVD